MRMVWTIALRSRMNHRNSLRYSGSLPNRVPRLGAEGRASAEEKLPLSPRCAPHALNHTAPVIATLAAIQQCIIPHGKEKDPSDCPPTNNRNHGHGTTVKML